LRKTLLIILLFIITSSIEASNNNYFLNIDSITLSRDYYNEGQIYKLRSLYDSAFIFYDKALSYFPNNTNAIEGKASIYYYIKKNYIKAIKEFDKLITIEPNNHEYYNKKSMCKIQLKDFNGALNDINKSIEINPNYSLSYKLRASIKININNDYLNANLDYTKALELDELPSYYYDRGINYLIIADETIDKDKKNYYSRCGCNDLYKANILINNKSENINDILNQLNDELKEKIISDYNIFCK
jgi:tetratricopeptide (TPR) repeat protein